MIVYRGKSVFGGIAIGAIQIFEKNRQKIIGYKVTDLEAEVKRFDRARKKAKEQVWELYEKALREVGEESAAIFEVHHMLMDDTDYIQSVLTIIIEQEVNAEYGVALTGERYAQMFEDIDDAYLRERAADIRDVSERIIDILLEYERPKIDNSEPVILMANDFAPSETVMLDKEKVLSFVTVEGSANSHTAILARTMNIPALVQTEIELDDALNGRMAIVDGFEGVLYIDPTPELLAKKQEEAERERRKQALLKQLRGKENITLDGRKINVYANIGNLKDLALVRENDAQGIGLFRSEFLYLESEDFPTEEEQFQAYRAVAEAMEGKKVIIRTMDLGADKQTDYFRLEKEDNPALGFRAIRICLTRQELFRTQIRAILRASACGNVSMMYPMIVSLKEIRMILQIVEEVKAELRRENIPFQQDIEQGIMIETPAAAMISDLLAKEVDFFSIGTNDLSQYTMAIDRQNAQLDEFFDPHHPAILRMIQLVAEKAHQNGIWVGICGELGADLELTPAFLAMGIDELSVSPGRVLPLRKRIREIRADQGREDLERLKEGAFGR